MEDLAPPPTAAGWSYEEAAPKYAMTSPAAIAIAVGRFALAQKVDVEILFVEDRQVLKTDDSAGHHFQEEEEETNDCTVTAFGARPDDDSVDDATSFRAALAACRGGTVLVPVGNYRLDTTINVGNASFNPARNKTCDGTICAWCHCPVPPVTTRLHLSHGANVRRLSRYSDAITPVLRLTQFGCMITGDGGVVESENPSPRGVVNLGPTVMPPLAQMVAPGDVYPAVNPGVHGSIQFATIAGLRITGQYRCTNHVVPHMGACLPVKNFSTAIVPSDQWKQTTPLNPPWSNTSGFEQCGMWPGQTASFGRDGSVGLCLDSGEPWDGGQSVTYQNTIKDLVITGTDVALYGSKYTNANNYYNLQFVSNGAASYWFEFVDENSIFGGFTGGAFPGNPWPVHGMLDNGGYKKETTFQVIRAQRAYASIFLGVQAEPGEAQYFHFDNKSVQNSVFGNDNCPSGSVSEDPSFLTMSAGSVWGGANGPGQSAAVGEEANTISAHKLVCGSVNSTPPLGSFRGGVDLCASELASRSEVAALRKEVEALKKLVNALLASR